MGPASRDELGHDEPRFDRLAEADAVCEQQARAAHPERAHDGHELVGCDVDPPRLHRQQRRGPEGLLEQESVVVQAPLA